jgi:hypothetical protein
MKQPGANIGMKPTLNANGSGGFVVQQTLPDGHLRTYGGFASEQEARNCVERGDHAHTTHRD